jgi:hypothetical protein
LTMAFIIVNLFMTCMGWCSFLWVRCDMSSFCTRATEILRIMQPAVVAFFVVLSYLLLEASRPENLSNAQAKNTYTHTIHMTSCRFLHNSIQMMSWTRKDTWCLTNTYWQGFMRRHAQAVAIRAKGN